MAAVDGCSLKIATHRLDMVSKCSLNIAAHRMDPVGGCSSKIAALRLATAVWPLSVSVQKLLHTEWPLSVLMFIEHCYTQNSHCWWVFIEQC